MVSDDYVWIIWSSAFLVPWGLLYWRFPRHRRPMVWASLLTAPLGLTEPLFVPEYWSPPSLFNLNRLTGFDIESVIFCFGVGGVGVVLYDVLTRRRPVPLLAAEKQHTRHRLHQWAVVAPFVLFTPFYFLPWNPIFVGIATMVVGAVAASLCRPDLMKNALVGGGIFLIFYVLFLSGLEFAVPGYIGRVWNLEALSGLRIAVFPVEELLFAFAFGAYWSGVYEHLTWHRTEAAGRRDLLAGAQR